MPPPSELSGERFGDIAPLDRWILQGPDTLTARTEANMQLDRADACRHLAIHLDDEVGSLLDRARTTARNRTRQPEW
ncbi:hypothetical protein GOAMI_01_02460 [Gordonia amicalis NBRC 100051 = JCM 11271]|nr:hypothetical protein GOAMI_01_02460 [Gordonia amicalis NBRC 100051 = JCM 11271]